MFIFVHSRQPALLFLLYMLPLLHILQYRLKYLCRSPPRIQCQRHHIVHQCKQETIPALKISSFIGIFCRPIPVPYNRDAPILRDDARNNITQGTTNEDRTITDVFSDQNTNSTTRSYVSQPSRRSTDRRVKYLLENNVSVISNVSILA